MEQKDRMAYEVAMATLQDTREDCLRWLEDQEPEAARRRRSRWFTADPRATQAKRLRAS